MAMPETMISAQLSIYSLRQEHLSPAIEALNHALRARGLRPEVGAMSTQVVGEADVIFTALREGFTSAAANGHVVLTLTVSNACPVTDASR